MTKVIAWAYDKLAQVRDEEEGQGLVEYIVIIAAVAIAAIAALGIFVTGIGDKLTGILDAITV